MTFNAITSTRRSRKSTACLGETKAMAGSGPGSTIPQYSNLRRVPDRLRHILPLNVMKHYQCVVVGYARGVITVAISNQQDISMIEALSKLTGRTIFPVLVSPVRIQLLIQRIENNRRNKGKAFWEISTLHHLSIHALVMPFTLLREKNKPHQ